MKVLFWIGLVVLILGVASLLVPIPRSERSGFQAGDMHVGMEMRHEERVPPLVSAALILGGAGMLIAGRR